MDGNVTAAAAAAATMVLWQTAQRKEALPQVWPQYRPEHQPATAERAALLACLLMLMRSFCNYTSLHTKADGQIRYQ